MQSWYNVSILGSSEVHASVFCAFADHAGSLHSHLTLIYRCSAPRTNRGMKTFVNSLKSCLIQNVS